MGFFTETGRFCCGCKWLKIKEVILDCKIGFSKKKFFVKRFAQFKKL